MADDNENETDTLPGLLTAASLSTPNPPLDTVEAARADLLGDKPGLPKERIPLPTRPGLGRNASVPTSSVSTTPPPLPPGTILGEPRLTSPDSLSLMQLRRLVAEMPRVQAAPYAFVYRDAAMLAEEVEEWFAYSVEERARILKTHSSFTVEWGQYKNRVFVNYDEGTYDWVNAAPEQREEFMRRLVGGLREVDLEKRLRQLEALLYLVLGCWYEVAGVPKPEKEGEEEEEEEEEEEGEMSPEAERVKAVKAAYALSALQIEWIKSNVLLLFECGGVQAVFDTACAACLRECSVDPTRFDNSAVQKEAEQREAWCALTALYFCIEVARSWEDEGKRLELRAELLSLEPNLLIALSEIVSKIRWDDTIQLPLLKVLLTLWKSILVIIGGLPDAEDAKKSFLDPEATYKKPPRGPMITASPLDYHTFRQEISSKYPAYNPPPAYFPLEPDEKSILPPLRISTKPPSMPTAQPAHGTSILHQPVHIATPMPSPPPSPAAGKGTKKQNYQTNNMFPFLYPPLDASSNQLGGKGATDLQDALVSRKWEGPEIPTSILEAAELFAERMRATRGLKQLWEERDEFMKFERGWTDLEGEGTGDGEGEEGERGDDGSFEKVEKRVEKLPKHTYDGSVSERLQRVEDFYRDGLPHLQSIVMVLLKTILANVTALITQANGQNGSGGFHFEGAAKPENNGGSGANLDTAHISTEELDGMRSQEITAKAVSGMLIVLLKWFKVSHILKFEYLTQLLVDANYIPMVLKLLQTQETEKIVNYRCERDALNFFHYCRANSRAGLAEVTGGGTELDLDDDDDEAAPPPVIKLRRDEPRAPSPPRAPPVVPEVDELGMPTTELPLQPITSFSWRNFFSAINFLRVLQKVCKHKAHRNLMLITYKSATYLKKGLKVPQPELRLYTLKLFKNQVPYCGRKWRQNNMRVITAVYLHCRPELRDDWLCNGDVDADVEQSVPLEQSLRALTHWYNLRRYPRQMGARPGVLGEEAAFFAREVERFGRPGPGREPADPAVVRADIRVGSAWWWVGARRTRPEGYAVHGILLTCLPYLLSG
ncbi:N1221-domain-containing protein [Trichodelitschia bisporula]|uniref:N1221-domain-containing protein n=1 Tax=Trichodelitschia bisporula TaxID=703511 RepID=A0A6G1HMS0_9PEZI|nr:N1221-domain-containing protein [Trichodelitschia bisporula]